MEAHQIGAVTVGRKSLGREPLTFDRFVAHRCQQCVPGAIHDPRGASATITGEAMPVAARTDAANARTRIRDHHIGERATRHPGIWQGWPRAGWRPANAGGRRRQTSAKASASTPSPSIGGSMSREVASRFCPRIDRLLLLEPLSGNGAAVNKRIPQPCRVRRSDAGDVARGRPLRANSSYRRPLGHRIDALPRWRPGLEPESTG